MSPTGRVFTSREAAAYLSAALGRRPGDQQIKERHVQRAHAMGRLKGAKDTLYPGHRLIFTQAQLDDYLLSRQENG